MDELNSYLQDMSQANCWGDGNVLSAAALLYGYAINVYVPDHARFTIGNEDLKSSSCLNIGFVGGNHYVSLEQVVSELADTNNNESDVASSEISQAAEIALSNNRLLSESDSDNNSESSKEITNEPSKLTKIEPASDDIRFHPLQPRKITFPVRMIGNKKRSFQPRWFDLYPWLEWDSSVNAAFCHRCRMSRKLNLITFSHNREVAFYESGFMNWKKAIEAFNQHENSSAHKEANLKWSGYMQSRNVSQLRPSQSDAVKHARRQTLIKLFDSLRFLARQGLATRGHTNETSNYHQLLSLRAKDSNELDDWLHSDAHNKWLSHDVESEMIQKMSHAVLRQLVEDICAHDYFAIIVDETTDVSRVEQISMCIRHVDVEFNICDDFIGLYATPKTDAATVTSVIKDILCRLNIPLNKLRAQCYDGASNMAGIHTGVQKRIREENSKAVYVHCTNHSLNLALQDASSRVTCIRDALALANELTVFFRDSAKRTAVFESVLANMNEDPKSRLVPLCPTRWTVRAKALKAVLKNYGPILQALDELSNEAGPTGAKAAGLWKKLTTFESFLGLNIAHEVFGITEQLAVSLQNKQMTLTASKVAAMKVVATLSDMRDDKHFEGLWLTVQKAADDLELLPPVLPRKRKVPKRIDGGDAQYDFTNVATKHRVETWCALIDILCGEISQRFSQECFQHVADVENVLLLAACGKSVTVELQHLAKFYDEFDYNLLEAQLKIFKNLFTSPPSTVQDIVMAIQASQGCARLLLNEVLQLVKLVLVVPATSASAERSFSALNRLKTYMRSTVGQARLNHLIVLHCHQDRTDKLIMQRVAQEFISCNEKRATFFGNF